MNANMYIPTTLKRLPIWILWRLETVNGRESKIPYSALYEGKASSTNSNTWTTYRRAYEALREDPHKYQGIGIAISREYRIIFIDVDHCIDEEGLPDDRACDVLDTFYGSQKTFIERSQSGRGLHILAFGEIPKSFKNSKTGIEVYDQARFCAMTGDAVKPCDIGECQESIEHIYNKYKLPDKPKYQHRKTADQLYRSDSEIIDKARENSQKFSTLYSGQWQQLGYGSQSEGDAALCTILAFWTDADPAAIDRIFKTSGLYREKWDRADYKQRTIEKACSMLEETVSEYQLRRQREEGKEFEKVFIQRW